MYILIDIGATNTRVATSNGQGIDAAVKFDAPEQFQHGVAKVLQACDHLASGAGISHVCVGVPGVIGAKGELLHLPNLPDWKGKPLQSMLTEHLDADVFVKNDADLGGLGESVFGAGKGHDIVAFLTFSSGVGGTRIVRKQIDVSMQGFEPGHQLIDIDVTACAECHSGTLHEYVAGKELAHRMKQDLETVEDDVFWHDIETLVAVGVYNAVLFWSPSLVVVGGGVIHNGKVSLERIQEQVYEMQKIFTRTPGIVVAELGDDAGLWGGLAYIRQLGV